MPVLPVPVLPEPVLPDVPDRLDTGPVETFGYALMTRDFPSRPGPGAIQLSGIGWPSLTAITRSWIPMAASSRFAPAIPDLG